MALAIAKLMRNDTGTANNKLNHFFGISGSASRASGPVSSPPTRRRRVRLEADDANFAEPSSEVKGQSERIDLADDVSPRTRAPVGRVSKIGPIGDGAGLPVPRIAPLRRQGGGGDHPALAVYLRELGQHPIITREEEHELAVQFSKTGDPALAARLVTANLRLVVKIAREHRRAQSNLLDLIQEGNVGLVRAVEKYDPHRGVKFSSYASWWIRAYMLKFVLANWRLVKVGTTQPQRRLFFNLHRERQKLEKQGVQVEAKHLAAALDVSEEEVLEMERRLNASEMSLDAPVRSKDHDDQPRGTLVSGPSGSRPDVQVEATEFELLLKEKLTIFGATLRDRELEIFNTRLLSEEPKTLVELAERFGVTRERTRQLEVRLKEKLRMYLETELGEGLQPEDLID
jgi:RNA polymerase sigma-32 factor